MFLSSLSSWQFSMNRVTHAYTLTNLSHYEKFFGSNRFSSSLEFEQAKWAYCSLDFVFISHFASSACWILFSGHDDWPALRNSGPCSHSPLLTNLVAVVLRDKRSEALSLVGTYGHCFGSVALWIVQILLATKGLNVLLVDRTHHNTFMLSDRNTTLHLKCQCLAFL